MADAPELELEYGDAVTDNLHPSVRKNIALKLKPSPGKSKRGRKSKSSKDEDLEATLSQGDSIEEIKLTLLKGAPEPLQKTRKLRWDHKVNLLGEKVLDPLIHCCENCQLPILIYGRLIPCKHVFCLECGKRSDKKCARCGDPVQRVESAAIGTVFVCTHGGAKHGVSGCRRTYLSNRDLQAHIQYRHLREQPAPQQQVHGGAATGKGQVSVTGPPSQPSHVQASPYVQSSLGIGNATTLQQLAPVYMDAHRQPIPTLPPEHPHHLLNAQNFGQRSQVGLDSYRTAGILQPTGPPSGPVGSPMMNFSNMDQAAFTQQLHFRHPPPTGGNPGPLPQQQATQQQQPRNYPPPAFVGQTSQPPPHHLHPQGMMQRPSPTSHTNLQGPPPPVSIGGMHPPQYQPYSQPAHPPPQWVAPPHPLAPQQQRMNTSGPPPRF